MKTSIKSTLWGLSLASLLMTGCSSAPTVVADYEVVPAPLQITTAQQSPFVLKSGAVIGYPAGNAKMQKNAEFLAAFLKDQTGMVLKTAEGEGNITLQLGMQDENPEAYQLKVNSDGIVISAPSEAGVFYGIQTLRKSVSAAPDSQVEFPAVEIVDKPRFGYRGMMLDVGRHFFSMDELKTDIDMLALHNINRFHWHLSEDQGWRIEIQKYPKLTEIGSPRKEPVLGRHSG